MRVKLFATLKQKAGASEIEIPIEEALTVRDLQAVIIETYPMLSDGLSVSVVAVNRQYAELDTMVDPADEIAFFPPVSGG